VLTASIQTLRFAMLRQSILYPESYFLGSVAEQARPSRPYYGVHRTRLYLVWATRSFTLSTPRLTRAPEGLNGRIQMASMCAGYRVDLGRRSVVETLHASDGSI